MARNQKGNGFIKYIWNVYFYKDTIKYLFYFIVQLPQYQLIQFFNVSITILIIILNIQCVLKNVPETGLEVPDILPVFKKNLFIYFWPSWVFVAVHRLSLVAASGGHSPAVHRFLTVVASLIAQHGLQGILHSPQQLWPAGLSRCSLRSLECRLIACGTWAQLPCSMWDLPEPGIELMSLALQGRF